MILNAKNHDCNVDRTTGRGTDPNPNTDFVELNHFHEFPCFYWTVTIELRGLYACVHAWEKLQWNSTENRLHFHKHAPSKEIIFKYLSILK